MAKQKRHQASVSHEMDAQTQQLFEQYHQIARDLYTSKDQKQAEAALTEINSIPEDSQLALLKALSKEQHTHAADVLVGFNELSPLKEVRKEARRLLIRLEGSKIYPRWKPPIERTLLVDPIQSTSNPPRFWKGYVTDSLDLDEVQLILAWQQGEDYKEVRVLGFLLEFWQEGVKDFFTQLESKRSFENFVNQIALRVPDVHFKDCSLAEGRRLLQNALTTNTRTGTKPHRDYQLHLSLVKQLIPSIEDEDEDVDLSNLRPTAIVSNFVEALVAGEFGIAYKFLAQESPLREGLTKDAWSKRRDEWDNEFVLDDLEPNLLYEREAPKSRLWLPASFSKGSTTTEKVIEAAWSTVMEKLSLDGWLPELPEPSAVYAQTGRHWFWASYTLVQENGEWRIQSMTDEGAQARNLSVEELRQRIQQLDKAIEKQVKKIKPEMLKRLNDDETLRYAADVLQPILQTIYYTDALLTKLPLDRVLYEETATRAMILGQHERSLVYLTPLVERFPEEHDSLYRHIAAQLRVLSQYYAEQDDDERAEHCQELEKDALRASLDVKDGFEARISLAEVLLRIGEDELLDEAEEHLLQAKTQVTDPGDEAHIELHLGEIATARDQLKEALSHYQRMAELQPDSAEAWLEVGKAHQLLENMEEAETSYKRAIELEPENEELYSELGLFYKETSQFSKAVAALEDGLTASPDSFDLHFYMALLYVENGDYEQAEMFLEKAERLDPESPLIGQYRKMMALGKSLRKAPAQIPRALTQQKRKGKHRH